MAATTPPPPPERLDAWGADGDPPTSDLCALLIDERISEAVKDRIVREVVHARLLCWLATHSEPTPDPRPPPPPYPSEALVVVPCRQRSSGGVTGGPRLSSAALERTRVRMERKRPSLAEERSRRCRAREEAREHLLRRERDEEGAAVLPIDDSGVEGDAVATPSPCDLPPVVMDWSDAIDAFKKDHIGLRGLWFTHILPTLERAVRESADTRGHTLARLRHLREQFRGALTEKDFPPLGTTDGELLDILTAPDAVTQLSDRLGLPLPAPST